jgi:succinate dehydrogenase / fumarate reductase membrane anchor subunit
MSLETPLHKVEGLGPAHSGVRQFFWLRVTGAGLGVLSIWFAYAILGLVGTSEATILTFLQSPLHSVLMGAFILLCAYHMTAGLREVVEDYVHTNGVKIFLLLLIYVFAIAVCAVSLFALLRIVIP